MRRCVSTCVRWNRTAFLAPGQEAQGRRHWCVAQDGNTVLSFLACGQKLLGLRPSACRACAAFGRRAFGPRGLRPPPQGEAKPSKAQARRWVRKHPLP